MTKRKMFKVGDQVWLYCGISLPIRGIITRKNNLKWEICHDNSYSECPDEYIYAYPKDAKLLIELLKDAALAAAYRSDQFEAKCYD